MGIYLPIQMTAAFFLFTQLSLEHWSCADCFHNRLQQHPQPQLWPVMIRWGYPWIPSGNCPFWWTLKPTKVLQGLCLSPAGAPWEGILHQEAGKSLALWNKCFPDESRQQLCAAVQTQIPSTTSWGQRGLSKIPVTGWWHRKIQTSSALSSAPATHRAHLQLLNLDFLFEFISGPRPELGKN